MKEDLISIIIPCYNSELYLDKCISSILNQTYKNIEIIIVDDNSKDNSYKILNKYAKNHKNIKVFKNKKNSGAGYSRNFALKLAKGKYITFLDSDDYLENNYIEELYKTIIKENADISVCDIYIRYSDSINDIRNIAIEGKKDKLDFIKNGLAASPCNKLFKKEIIEKFPFAEGIMNEDIPTVISTLVYANKIVHTENTYYNYVQHDKSVQNSGINLKRLDLFKAIDILNERIKNNKDYHKYWDTIIFNQVILFLFYVIPKEKNRRQRKIFMKKMYEYTKKFDLLKNKELAPFLKKQGKKYKIYYDLFIRFYCHKNIIMVNNLIDFHHIYKDKLTKSVIKNATLDDLIRLSKKQSKIKNSNISISVVIPNYNYSRFLYQRLYSILIQKEKINEIIILDDVSKDDSRKKIDEIVDKLSKYINIKKVYNETNSGSAFKQWKKGFELATSDYVWIAEADDYCNNKFLSSIMKSIKKDNEIVISYCDTAFINTDGFIIMRSIKPEIDIMKTGHWNNNFINSGIDEYNNYSYLNCTIANVSSVVFKKNDYSKEFELSGNYKQAGDWLFYVNIMRKGKIAYYNKALNYYRLHGSNVTSQTKKQQHFDEIVKIHNYYKENYGINKIQEKQIKERYKFLNKVWNLK